MKNKLGNLLASIILFSVNVNSQPVNLPDSTFEKKIQRSFINNLPEFLKPGEKGGFYLIKLKILKHDSIPDIEVLNGGTNDVKKYFNRIFTDNQISNYFSPGTTVVIPIIFYEISNSFGISEKPEKLRDFQIINNSVFNKIKKQQNIFESVLFMRPQVIGFTLQDARIH